MIIKEVSKRTRLWRKIHRWIASILFVFFFIISLTGLLLTWKKNSKGYLLAKSYKGTSTALHDWLSFDSLHTIAVRTLRDSISSKLSADLDRIDARPDKGMVKFVFTEGYWAVQLDAATGKVLHLERRRADFIENLHDGSYLDKVFGTEDQQLKLGYATIMGASLFMLTLSGFWLWYNPKRIRKQKLHTHT
jgi:uncharacterized iron-regulated membrane protein